MKCPYCRANMESINYEELPIIDVWEITRNWHYECPNCGRKWIETYVYKCTEHTIDESEVET